MSGKANQLVLALQLGLVEAAARRDFRVRMFPPGAACACGVASALLLVSGRRPVICYECSLLRRGRSPFELHHIGGSGSWLVVRLPANRHRLHDAAYQDVLERLPLTQAERTWIELQLFLTLEKLLDQAEQNR
jgi:hypothetical protein